jgi:predicted MFS family arabinose efflux permease
MGALRGAMGFLTFLLAFTLKQGGQPAWFFGLVLAASGAGGFLGAVLAPAMRKRTKEEVILVGALLVPAVVALLGARSANRPAVLIVALFIAMGAAAGKLAFDSLLQRDAPDAARGRAFARFETRFQLVWVLGALLAVVGQFGDRTGFLLLTLGLGFGGLSYLGGVRSAPRGPIERPALPPGRPSSPSEPDGTMPPRPTSRPRQSSGLPAELRRRMRRLPERPE